MPAVAHRRRLQHLRTALAPAPVPDAAAAAAAATTATTPFDWLPEDWQRLEQQRRPIFDEARLAQIDRGQFLEDGFVLLDSIMTAHGRHEWTAALQRGQRTRDAMIREDWRASIDWAALFRASPPTVRPTAEQIAASEGCMQEPPGDESCGTTTLKNNGIFVDHFSAGHLPFLMDVLTHPQMLQLQRLLLGSEHVLVDHNSLLSRKGGYEGGGWHSHPMNSKNWCVSGRERLSCGNSGPPQFPVRNLRLNPSRDPMAECDNGQPTTPEVYDQQPNFVLNLVYPEGFAAEDDGGLKFIPGSHLWRDPGGLRAQTDEDLESGWLQGKRHPVTQQPLQIVRPALGPGSMVCVLSHGAHAVSPKRPGAATRWCSLFCYRKEDDRVPPPLIGIPPRWVRKADDPDDPLPPALRDLLVGRAGARRLGYSEWAGDRNRLQKYEETGGRTHEGAPLGSTLPLDCWPVDECKEFE